MRQRSRRIKHLLTIGTFALIIFIAAIMMMAHFFYVGIIASSILVVATFILTKQQRDETQAALQEKQQALAEARSSQRRYAFLAQVSQLLASSLDHEKTLNNVAHAAIPFMGDFCIFGILEDNLIRIGAVAHCNPAMERTVRELRGFQPSLKKGHPVAEAIAYNRSILFPHITGQSLEKFANSPEHLAVLRKLHPTSYLIVPLHSRNQKLGVLLFAKCEGQKPYTEAERSLAEDLAQRAGVALDNALLYQKANEAIHTRDLFVSVASHELKTPLTTLRSLSQVILKKYTGNQELETLGLRRVFQLIDQQSAKMDQLVSRLLDISRMEIGKFFIEPKDTDISALITGIAAAEIFRSPKHPIEISAPGSLVVKVDPLKFEQVVTNLLDNAIKYSPGGGKIKVRLREGADNFIHLMIRDHGLGIPQQSIPNIFDRFYQAHSDKQIPGMGIGLFISRQIIELHGGGIKVFCPPGGGSRFTITLPKSLPVSAAHPRKSA